MAKLFFIGDSITAGVWDKNGGWASRLIGQVMDKNIASEAQNGSFYCMPYNLGISGDTVPDLLRRIEREIKARIYGDKPEELVQIVFAIGANDSIYLVDEDRQHYSDEEFQEDMVALIKLAKTFTDNISFIGLLPVDETLVNPCPWAPQQAHRMESTEHFDGMIETLCQQHGVAFLPMFDRWLSMPDYESYLIDGLHPSSAGHKKMAKEIGEFLFTEDFTDFHNS